jgi:hypothetical protein
MRKAIAIALVMLAGCSGPRHGDVYSMAGGGMLYAEEGLFRTAVEQKEAGVTISTDSSLDLYLSKRQQYLDGSAEVKVIERIDGGAKVIVTEGDEKGSIGWIMDSDLPDHAKR